MSLIRNKTDIPSGITFDVREVNNVLKYHKMPANGIISLLIKKRVEKVTRHGPVDF